MQYIHTANAHLTIVYAGIGEYMFNKWYIYISARWMIFKITQPFIFRSRKHLKIMYTSKYSDSNPGMDVAIKITPRPPPPKSFSLMRVIAACAPVRQKLNTSRLLLCTKQ
jgi:hypothetical protein